MRIHYGLPKTFWADGVSIDAYLINRGPSVPLGFKIPEEEWTGKELKYSHLRTFGCTAYVHVDPEKRLDAKAIKCYFIGYGSDMFEYRFWDERNKKILRHCDMTFDENVLYKDREQKVQETTKQVGVELELPKSTPKDVAADTQQTLEIIVEEPEVEQVTPEQVERRSSRTIRAPDRYSPSLHYLLLTDEGEPESVAEALQVEDPIKWEQAMDDEMSSLEKNNTWMLTELPAGKRALLNKWVFRIKAEPDDKRRFKARLVVKGYSQRKGIDYAEIFSPVVKLTTIRILLSIVASENLHLEQIDVHANPGKEHWEAVKWLLRYLKGTSSTSLCFGNGEVILQGFVDADLSGDVDSSMSTSGYIYTIGGTAVSWMSRLQKCVALSSTELSGRTGKQLKKILYTDSQSAIQLVKNPVYHSKTKHIRRRYHFTRRAVEEGDMCLEKIEGAKNPADMLTKYVGPLITTAVLKFHCRCQGCIQKIDEIVTKFKGYKEMKVDEQKDLVTVTGSMDMKVLAETLKKHLKKEIEIVPPKKEGGEKKDKGGGDNGGGGGKGKGAGVGDKTNCGTPSSDLRVSQLDSDKVGFIAELEEDKLRAETRRKSDNDFVKIRNSMLDCQSKDDSINASKISMVSTSGSKNNEKEKKWQILAMMKEENVPSFINPKRRVTMLRFNIREWDDLRNLFVQGAMGSKIIVTTRKESVSQMMGSGAINVGILSNKCKGLPLALKALSGSLCYKSEVDEWTDVLRSEIWEQTLNDVLPALMLSYNDLPAHLKQCFSFCAIYPKDYQFCKEQVIHLWIANGLVQQLHSGHQYFNELRSRSLFERVPESSVRDGGKFLMHDLVNDLAQIASSKLCVRLEACQGSHMLEQINIQRLRYSDLSKRVLRNILPRLTYLRALSLSRYEIEELPDALFIKLKLLRFLDLSWTEIKKLPDSICVLYNLETLLLSSCKYLEELPLQMEKLINLRHLDIKETAAAAEKNNETAATAEQRSRRLILERIVFIHQLVVNI
ncbi:putative disease resistance RPP13-like protein 1-like [Capsicum annuum]|nr:putative disease resistance RPP13-like protein 1-like [Capsicum annuum]